MNKGQLQYMNGELQTRITDLEQQLKDKNADWDTHNAELVGNIADLDLQVDRLTQELNAKAWDDRIEELERELAVAKKDRQNWIDRHKYKARDLQATKIELETAEAELAAAKKETNLWKLRVDEAGDYINDYEEIQAELEAAQLKTRLLQTDVERLDAIRLTQNCTIATKTEANEMLVLTNEIFVIEKELRQADLAAKTDAIASMGLLATTPPSRPSIAHGLPAIELNLRKIADIATAALAKPCETKEDE